MLGGGSCQRVFPAILVSSAVGFVFGFLFSKTEMIPVYKQRIMHSFSDRNSDFNRQPSLSMERTNHIHVPRDQLSNSNINSIETAGIQSVCTMGNISGKVLSRNMTSWNVNDGVCNGSSSVTSKFVRANLRGPQRTPIYVYGAKEDVWVSGNIIRQGMWEGGWVTKIHSILAKDRDYTFIDIGANVGVFCLTAAKLGRKVIAVDALEGNVARLCKSVEAGNLKNNIVLIHNAISNTREKVSLGVHRGNVGGTYVKKLNLTVENKYVVHSILLDDLLEIFNLKKVVIKMDVETFEAKILEGGSKFFSTVDVRFLLMEFGSHRKSKSGAYIINFLKEHSLEPEVHSKVIRDYSKWPAEVLFRKIGF